MPKLSMTTTVTTTSSVITPGMTNSHNFLNLTNLDTTNKLWVQYINTGVALAEADDNICIRPSETITIEKCLSFSAIAEVASCKLHVWVST